MRNRFLAVFLALIVFVHPLIPSASAAEGNTQSLTQQQVTEALLALQTDFPEGMIWTNQSPATAYIWAFRGTVVAMSGCAAFAAIAQDQVFGSIQDAPVTWQRITKDCPVQGMPECAAPYSWDTLWPGDILKFSGHSVIVLQKYENHVTVAEGNNGGQIRWGRAITKEGVATANYVLTRYTKAEPLMPFTDLPDRSHWAYKPIIWALMENVAAPISATSFGQNGDCTRAEMISFLWRLQILFFWAAVPTGNSRSSAPVCRRSVRICVIMWKTEELCSPSAAVISCSATTMILLTGGWRDSHWWISIQNRARQG